MLLDLVKSDVAEGATNTPRPLTQPSDSAEGGLLVDATQTPEEWRPVAGFEEYIEVSSLGRVRSLDRQIPIEFPGAKPYLRTHRGKILKQARHPRGYMYITIAGGGNLRPNTKVHHLVLEAFIGPRPAGMECCHANDVPDDNRLENLRWDTPEANLRDAVINGKRKWSHCTQGHEFTPENSYLLKDGSRRCRTCKQQRERKVAS